MGKVYLSEADYISVYTRADALLDGTLIDLTPVMRNEGVVVPVAITSGAYHNIGLSDDLDPGRSKFIERIRNMFWMLRIYAKKKEFKDTDSVSFSFPVKENNVIRKVKLVFVVHPGDKGEPVMTIMLPHED